jgi:hypothetical protein
MSTYSNPRQSGAPLRSVPLWINGCAAPTNVPRKKTFEDLVAEAERAESATLDEEVDSAAS